MNATDLTANNGSNTELDIHENYGLRFEDLNDGAFDSNGNFGGIKGGFVGEGFDSSLTGKAWPKERL